MSDGRPPFHAKALVGAAAAFATTLSVLAPVALAAGGEVTTTQTPSSQGGDATPLPDSVRGGSTSGGPDLASGSGGGAFVRMIVGLAIVLAVVFAVYWLLKTYGKSRKKELQGDGKMEVVATTVLAPERSVHLLKIGDEYVLVGTSEKSVTPIRVYKGELARRLGPLLDAEEQLRTLQTGSNGGKGLTLTRLVDELRARTART